MFDQTKFLRLFEIEPELKPPGLEHNPGGVAAPEDPDGAKTLPVWTISCEGIAIDPGPGDEWKQDEDDEPELVSIIPNQAAAALIRDRAVMRLISRGYEVILTEEVDEDEGGKRFIGVCLKTDESLVGFTHPDPTEALYLACCKVLEVEP